MIPCFFELFVVSAFLVQNCYWLTFPTIKLSGFTKALINHKQSSKSLPGSSSIKNILIFGNEMVCSIKIHPNEMKVSQEFLELLNFIHPSMLSLGLNTNDLITTSPMINISNYLLPISSDSKQISSLIKTSPPRSISHRILFKVF